MAKLRNQRIIPFILVIVIVIIAIAALVSLARAVFFSDRPTEVAITDTSRQQLLAVTADSSVRMTVRGPIVADEEFNSYSVVVSPSRRAMTTYTGYLDTIVDQVNYGNNSAAYEEFVYALDKAQYATGKQLDEDEDDTRGVCALGRVYEFYILDGSDVTKRLWTTSCRGLNGSLRADATHLRNLFHAQIPESNSLLTKIDIR
ncbi:hypothetical protein B7Y94_05590 [Candidatus Saccharibacteria bacterium 32-49-12]|nr:MAG: hypothetical protein B7Y94_05590 [Candidatus Saccharibacteria bacterium 32-49-12]